MKLCRRLARCGLCDVLMPKYRIEYAKKDLARFLSHLELLRTFNRALRRAQLPVAFTQGFTSRPKVSFGPPLSVGIAGLREYLEVELKASVPPRLVSVQVGCQLPAGLLVGSVAALPPFAPALSKILDCAWYRVHLEEKEKREDVWQKVLEELRDDASPWPYRRPRDGKFFNVKSGVKVARIFAQAEELFLDLLVRIGSGEVPLRGLLEVLWTKAGFFEPPLSGQITRMGLYRQQHGTLVTPLEEEKDLWEK